MGVAFVACTSKKDIETTTTATIVPGSAEDFAQNVSNTVYFGFDRYNLTPEAEDVLKAVAAWFQTYPNKQFVIEGHTDKRGTQDYNLGLGSRRAESVKTFLTKSGLDKSRMSTISYGKECLVSQGDEERDHAENRRAHIVVQ
ncbi:peptidoglycan-associated lipoprotein [Alphaproteobacteria bacterium]|nr:peptidoglycan-associated lipoprotein [Alphaproteobacteria bacterium]GHS97765.1 peptidoglycan-associated lipoprotein [Alphaproteobacteria bacterium]